MSRFRMFPSAKQPRKIGRKPIELRRTPSIPVATLDDPLLIECGKPGGDLGYQETVLIGGPRLSEEPYIGAEIRRIGIVLLLGLVMTACTRQTATDRVAASAVPFAIGNSAHTGTGRPPPPGSRTITRADDGGTLRITVGEALILRLPGNTIWDVQITDPQVIAADLAAMPARGEQWIYRARRAGVTELVAVALPPCAKDRPSCEVMAPAFRLLVVVR
jgi:hypothetical protein